MPELPEVETTRRGLLPLTGQRVARVAIRNPALRWPIPDDLPQLLPHQHFLELTRRAKYILVRCEQGTLLLHLGMSGRLCLLPQFEAPQKHDHLDIVFESGQVLRLRDPRRFGAVLWLPGDPLAHTLLRDLGPEPLQDGFDGAYLHRYTRSRPGTIKTTLMDSHLVVGVGNIYASESLFRAGINPQTPANKISKPRYERLAAEVRKTLQEAIAAGGSSLRDFYGADGNPGYFQQEYFVYGRTGQPCKQCGTAIRQIRQGQRSTFYCPGCQK
jgi:formamidopyrimidine-DNA glycosylase